VQKIEQICVGFDDPKEKVFNLVQLLKMIFLYILNKRDPSKKLRETSEACRAPKKSSVDCQASTRA
jgi:hypothetical protein